ncbi:PEP-CTERM sorting domain-containing protein [Colwellia sp. 4_MG-2023]|uniref:PEP-CTERM sorting domain-containing protein n=1 Tax=unclassified Colwellia TaxID=196834 RepID=UPI0026E297E7|nr:MULTISPECIES: PEP-CTERM sorting domain-containing protein [unclassified Colwellia]MDO6505428.1 PEP-CTERM sorting domain-containing protein [Colwellia sp. 5_MG-2023]MDO6554276.1 PEP-CTERM sorting domain-containing protein [Colwellia sp. 4_MG-2023]
MQNIKNYLSKIYAVIILMIIVPFANAGIITSYYFTGQCQDCYANADGSYGTAEAILELVDYTWGDAILLTNFVSFEYFDTDLFSGFSVTDINSIDSLSGTLINNDFEITAGKFFFESLSFSDPLVTAWETGCVFGAITGSINCRDTEPDTGGGSGGAHGSKDFGSSPNWVEIIDDSIADPIIHEVPEPSTFAILAFGIMLLVSRHKISI